MGHGTWHPGSDLALAVEGMPPEKFFQALAALRELLPPGLDVDLVDLAQAGEALRARILGEKTMAEEPVHALKELVEDELAALGHIVQAVQEGLGSLEEPPAQFALSALASSLDQFYTGCERKFNLRPGHVCPERGRHGNFWSMDHSTSDRRRVLCGL